MPRASRKKNIVLLGAIIKRMPKEMKSEEIDAVMNAVRLLEHMMRTRTRIGNAGHQDKADPNRKMNPKSLRPLNFADLKSTKCEDRDRKRQLRANDNEPHLISTPVTKSGSNPLITKITTRFVIRVLRVDKNESMLLYRDSDRPTRTINQQLAVVLVTNSAENERVAPKTKEFTSEMNGPMSGLFPTLTSSRSDNEPLVNFVPAEFHTALSSARVRKIKPRSEFERIIVRITNKRIVKKIDKFQPLTL